MARFTLAFAAAALALAGPAQAKEGNGQGHGQHGSQAHGGHGAGQHGPAPKRLKACPPGLAKKHTGCLPPGQWRKGDQLPAEWAAHYLAYAALPDFYRSRYEDDARRRYVYRDGRVFVIHAVTRVILDVIQR